MNAIYSGAHKVGAAISGPRIASKTFYGHEVLLTELCRMGRTKFGPLFLQSGFSDAVFSLQAWILQGFCREFCCGFLCGFSVLCLKGQKAQKIHRKKITQNPRSQNENSLRRMLCRRAVLNKVVCQEANLFLGKTKGQQLKGKIVS